MGPELKHSPEGHMVWAVSAHDEIPYGILVGF